MFMYLGEGDKSIPGGTLAIIEITLMMMMMMMMMI